MTDANVTAVANQLMRAVVRSGCIRHGNESDISLASSVMREELKALLFADMPGGDKYTDERALIMSTGHANGLAFASIAAECVRRILAERS